MRFFRCCTHVNFASFGVYVSDTCLRLVSCVLLEARRGEDGNRTSGRREPRTRSVSSVTESNWSRPEQQLKTKHCYDTHDTHRPPHCAEQAVVTLVSRPSHDPRSRRTSLSSRSLIAALHPSERTRASPPSLSALLCSMQQTILRTMLPVLCSRAHAKCCSMCTPPDPAPATEMCRLESPSAISLSLRL